MIDRKLFCDGSHPIVPFPSLKPSNLCDEAQETLRRHIIVGGSTLWEIAQHRLGRLPFGDHIMTINPGAASTWLEKACDHLHGRGFASAIRPKEPENRSFGNVKCQPFHNLAITKSLGELL